jgi:hypothetical protein
LTPGFALEDSPAVTGLATASTGLIEFAVGSWPNATHFGAGVHTEGPGFAAIELPATSRDGRGPNGVGAVVSDIESGCMRKGEEKRDEKQMLDEEAHFGESVVGTCCFSKVLVKVVVGRN